MLSSSSSDPELFIRKHIPMIGSNLTELMTLDSNHQEEDVPIVLKHISRVLMSNKENFNVKGVFESKKRN